MRDKNTAAAAISAVQDIIGCQSALIAQTAQLAAESIKPEGTLSIKKNGSYDVSKNASAEVNVKSHLFTVISTSAANSVQLPAKVLAMPSFLMFCVDDYLTNSSGKVFTVWRQNGRNDVCACFIDSSGTYRRVAAGCSISDTGLLTVDFEGMVFTGNEYYIICWDMWDAEDPDA